jgi:hypothetical protein
MLRKLVLNRFPAWEKQILEWEDNTGNAGVGCSIYLEANTTRNSPWVAARWTASCPDLMATFHRNLDKDCSGIDVLENAPVNAGKALELLQLAQCGVRCMLPVL